MTICRLKTCIIAHSVFLLFVSAVLSEFKLNISLLISTNTSLYKSFVFFSEFKRFSLNLTDIDV